MSLRKVAFVFALFALSVLQVLFAADPPKTLNPIGFPKKGDPGGGIGAVRIWYDNGVWHLRTSTENSVGKKDKLMVFTGTVRSELKMSSVDANKLENKGNGKGKTADRFVVHQDGKGFDFEFKTFGAVDQVDFKLPDKAKTLNFKVFIDGEKAPRHRIIIGADGEHPEKNEFTLPPHPKK